MIPNFSVPQLKIATIFAFVVLVIVACLIIP